jgi:hypothetical protein
LVAGFSGGQPGPGRPKQWTDERIRAELTVFLRGRESWPTQPEFADAGLGGLYGALSRNRGVSYWAAEYGLPLSAMQDRSSLDEAAALSQARDVVVEHGVLLGGTNLRRLGRQKLARYLDNHGGAAAFGEKHGLPYRRTGRNAWRDRTED